MSNRYKLEQARLLIDEVLNTLPLDTPPDTTLRQVFGNSIARGYGSSTNWPSLRAAAKGWPIANNAVNGAMTWDQTPQVISRIVLEGDKSIVSLGTNEIRHWTVSNLPEFQRSHKALIAWLATPESKKIRGKTLSGVGWGNTYAYGIGKASGVQGSILETSFSGDTLLVGSIAQVGNIGSFDIYVDNVKKASVSCGSVAPATINGSQYGSQLEVVMGCGVGSHTAKFVVTSPSVVGSMAYVEWVGTPSEGASVDVYNTPIQAGVSTENTNLMCSSQLSDVLLLKSLGMNINYYDINSVLTLSDMPDGAHPNDTGHTKIALVEAT